MASYKKAGNANIVAKNQFWKNTQNGRIGFIAHKGSRGKEWIMTIGKKSHHVNEGTLLKLFIKL